MARMATIHPSVIAALRWAGALNAITPLEIASVPVIAAHPSAKPRISRYASANPVMDDIPPCRADTGSTSRRRQLHELVSGHDRYVPTPSSVSIMPMKTIRRDAEGGARLAHAAQVHRREQQDRRARRSAPYAAPARDTPK